jgi:hypothetical protein
VFMSKPKDEVFVNAVMVSDLLIMCIVDDSTELYLFCCSNIEVFI